MLCIGIMQVMYRDYGGYVCRLWRLCIEIIYACYVMFTLGYVMSLMGKNDEVHSMKYKIKYK